MTPAPRNSTADAKGRLRGERARDWAEVQEVQFAAACHAAWAHAKVGPSTCHLDAGCGSGMAAALSTSPGDMVSGFNSFQYVGDAARALREVGRVTRPGGTIVTMTWGEPAGMEAAGHVAALKPLLPPPPTGAGGLTPLEVVDVNTPWHYHDLATAPRGAVSSNVVVKAAEHSGEDALVAAMTEFSMPFHKPNGSIGFNAAARYLVATV